MTTITVESSVVAATLRRLSSRYCWDSSPERAHLEAERVILRTCNVGTWEDTLDIERVFGTPTLRAILSQSPAGALTPRAWSFWHYRLGLADVDNPPPPQPGRMTS